MCLGLRMGRDNKTEDGMKEFLGNVIESDLATVPRYNLSAG